MTQRETEQTQTDAALTRWLPLWRKDKSLRPEAVVFVAKTTDAVRWAGVDSGQAKLACIRDAAVRWLRSNGTLILTPGGTEFSLWEPKVGLHSVSLDDRDDELYEIARDAVDAVLAAK